MENFMGIIEFPIRERMYKRWSNLSAERLTNKWEVDPKREPEIFNDMLYTITNEFKGDAEDWTQEEIIELIDSFFRVEEFIIMRRGPKK
tara:strand:+ start:17367 stop:17633 length:267 start_codon:yes stop_codon:yes gene_type:complete